MINPEEIKAVYSWMLNGSCSAWFMKARLQNLLLWGQSGNMTSYMEQIIEGLGKLAPIMHTGLAEVRQKDEVCWKRIAMQAE